MKIGDLAECAIWLDGTESLDMLRQWKADCSYLMANGHEPKLKLGPLTFEIKRPGENRVPPVPDRITGPDVRLLIASAEVLGFEVIAKQSFIADLDKKDLLRLRAATRKAHGKLTDDQCDALIERMGPVAGAEVVRRGVNGQMVH